MHGVRFSTRISEFDVSGRRKKLHEKAIDVDVLHKIEMNCTPVCLSKWSSDQMWMVERPMRLTDLIC